LKETEMSPVSRREDKEAKLEEETECKQLLARQLNE